MDGISVVEERGLPTEYRFDVAAQAAAWRLFGLVCEGSGQVDVGEVEEVRKLGAYFAKVVEEAEAREAPPRAAD